MNLLITNAHEDQAYLIVRSLLEEADRIVVTVCGDSVVQRWAGLALWSRHVSKRYRVPDCAVDWRAGIIQPQNSPAEERYVRCIEKICEIEGINAVFPSYDAEVYVFAKNRSRFADQGIIAVVPDYEALTQILDKSKTLEAAEKVGFPVPKTYLPGNLQELLEAARQLEPPWVLKPRCNAHGVNVKLARTITELEDMFTSLSAIQERPMLQEYVPPLTKRNYYVVVNRDSEVISMFSPTVHRFRKTELRTTCAMVESTAEVPFEAEIHALLRELGTWGGLTVQSLVDSRDGRPKLMEVNPRFGGNVWFRTEMGINEPLMLFRMAQDLDPGMGPSFRQGTILHDPLMDFAQLLNLAIDKSRSWIRATLGGYENGPGPQEKESIRGLLRIFRAEYFGAKNTLTSPLSRNLFSDPLPPLIRICRVILGAILRRGS